MSTLIPLLLVALVVLAVGWAIRHVRVQVSIDGGRGPAVRRPLRLDLANRNPWRIIGWAIIVWFVVMMVMVVMTAIAGVSSS